MAIAEIQAGARLSAAILNGLTPSVGTLTSSVSRTSSTALAATGLAVPVAADGLYAITGYVPYAAATAGDLRLALVAPAGCTGHWGVSGLASSVTAVTGLAAWSRSTAFTTAASLVLGGLDGEAFFGTIAGAVQVGATAGDLALFFGQGTSSATATSVTAGAWLRVTRITS